MALSVDINANTRQAQAQIKDLSKALDNTGDALDDLAREGDQAADKLERSFKDMVREAGKADTAIEKVGDSGGTGFSKASDAAGEFKQEALANFSEVASSFDGSMSSIQDLAQGTLGGLASSGLPGIGLAAGAAAAAVGLIGSAFAANEEAETAAKGRAAEWAQAYIDAGGFVLTAAVTTAKALEIITDADKFKEAGKNAENWGVSTTTAIAAMSGEAWALKATEEALAQKTRESNDAMAAQEQQSTSAAGAVFDVAEQVKAGTKSFEELTAAQQAGATQASTYSDYLRTMAENTAGATKEVDEFGDTIYTLPDGHQVYVDAETQQATDDLDAIEKKVYNVPPNAVTTVKVKVDSSAWDNWSPGDKVGNIRTANGRGSGGMTWY